MYNVKKIADIMQQIENNSEYVTRKELEEVLELFHDTVESMIYCGVVSRELQRKHKMIVKLAIQRGIL